MALSVSSRRTRMPRRRNHVKRSLQKGGGGRGVIGGEHLRVRQAGRVINRDMQILPADVARPATAIAMNAMADAG